MIQSKPGKVIWKPFETGNIVFTRHYPIKKSLGDFTDSFGVLHKSRAIFLTSFFLLPSISFSVSLYNVKSFTTDSVKKYNRLSPLLSIHWLFYSVTIPFYITFGKRNINVQS